MSTVKASDIYYDHVRALPVAERLKLISLIARDLTYEVPETSERPRRSILEFHGVGKGSRGDEDAQAYVDRLRSGWEDSAT